MGGLHKVTRPTEPPAEHARTWKLSDPGMDLPKRAGLAGLYMALRAAREAKTDLSPLKWTEADLTSESVTVRWTGPAKPAFEKLMEWAWQVQDGVLYLPAIHDEGELAQFHRGLPAITASCGRFFSTRTCSRRASRSPASCNWMRTGDFRLVPAADHSSAEGKGRRRWSEGGRTQGAAEAVEGPGRSVRSPR